MLPDGVLLADGRRMPAELVVWAAGVKAPPFLKDLAGLETNRINQLRGAADAADHARRRHLRHGRLRRLPLARGQRRQGRLRAAARAGGAPAGLAPGRRRSSGAWRASRCSDYRYRDFGSLVSLGEFSTVGNMMGGPIGGSLMIQGSFARLMYLSLYKMHELALHGFVKVALDTLARLITRRTEPHVKLH